MIGNHLVRFAVIVNVLGALWLFADQPSVYAASPSDCETELGATPAELPMRAGTTSDEESSVTASGCSHCIWSCPVSQECNEHFCDMAQCSYTITDCFRDTSICSNPDKPYWIYCLV